MSGGVSIEIGRGEGVKKDLQWSEMDLLGWVRLRVCVCACVWGGGGTGCVKLLKLEKGELGAKQAKLLNVKRQGHL